MKRGAAARCCPRTPSTALAAALMPFFSCTIKTQQAVGAACRPARPRHAEARGKQLVLGFGPWAPLRGKGKDRSRAEPGLCGTGAARRRAPSHPALPPCSHAVPGHPQPRGDQLQLGARHQRQPDHRPLPQRDGGAGAALQGLDLVSGTAGPACPPSSPLPRSPAEGPVSRLPPAGTSTAGWSPGWPVQTWDPATAGGRRWTPHPRRRAKVRRAQRGGSVPPPPQQGLPPPRARLAAAGGQTPRGDGGSGPRRGFLLRAGPGQSHQGGRPAAQVRHPLRLRGGER